MQAKIAGASMREGGRDPKLVIAATPDAPMARPPNLAAERVSPSQIAENTAPKRGDRAFSTDSTDAGT